MAETFLSAASYLAGQPQPDLVVLGARHGVLYPGDHPHAADAPAAIRHASRRLAGFAGHHDFDLDAPFGPGHLALVDAGDVTTRVDASSQNVELICDVVSRVVATGAIPIVLGGDDSVSAAVIRGLRGHPVTVLHLDAHLDFRDEVHGISDGFSSGMRRATEADWVRRVVHVGLRGVGSARPLDQADTLAAGNLIVTAREFAHKGPESALDRLDEGEPFVVSLDCDVFDPSVFPAVRAQVPGGLGYREVLDVLVGAIARGTLRGVVVTEYAPDRDGYGRSAETIARLISQMITALAAT